MLNKKVNLLQIFKQERNLAEKYDALKHHSPKKIVLITARSTPSDSTASFCLKGFIESYLQDNSCLGSFMRQKLVLVVVPLLNPDGVLLGNFSNGVAGHPLEEYLDEECKEIFPEIHYLKRYLSKLKSAGDELVCSIHIESTSQSHNSYMRTTIPTSSPEDKIAKIGLPALMHEWSSFFDIDKCM